MATSTSTKDPQTWVFPPAGAPTPPAMSETGPFGPVHLGDTIDMMWAPATRPDVRLTCASTDSYNSCTLLSMTSLPEKRN
jgi:hypothetical protein